MSVAAAEWRPPGAETTCRCPRPGCCTEGWAVIVERSWFLGTQECAEWWGWCPRHGEWMDGDVWGLSIPQNGPYYEGSYFLEFGQSLPSLTVAA